MRRVLLEERCTKDERGSATMDVRDRSIGRALAIPSTLLTTRLEGHAEPSHTRASMFQGVALVCATQVSDALFADATFLGRSLSRMPEDLRPQITIAFANSGPRALGLGQIFNRVLDQTDPQTNLIFLHDDVYLNDWFFAQRVLDALERFDIAGVAGSANPDLSQPSWGLRFDADLNPAGWQPGLQRSGAVNHFDPTCPKISVYGPTPLSCSLLDGVFLAVKTAVVKQHGLRFDPRFRFHCYDLDFCRSAAQKGLRLGTWPLSITHGSGGSYRSEEFKQSARLYLEKWSRPTEHPVRTGSASGHAEECGRGPTGVDTDAHADLEGGGNRRGQM